MSLAEPRTTRGERLITFANSVERKPIKWGVDDCSPWCALWFQSETGIPVPLPRYGSRDEAIRLMVEAGGLIHLWDDAVADLPVAEVSVPHLGDVGVVEISDSAQIGVIFAEGGFSLWRGAKGAVWFSPRPSRILRVWTF